MDKAQPIVATDGRLTWKIEGGERDGETFELDLIIAKLTAEKIQRKHNLETDDGMMIATAEFLAELGKAFEAIGVPEPTPTMTFRVWVDVGNRMAELKKNMS